MFDLGWGELLVVGLVALIVLGPKELPNALRTISNLTKTARKLASEFQSGVNEIVREADLEDARKAAKSISQVTGSKASISKAIEKVVDPTGEMKSTISGVEKEAKAAATFPPIPNPAVERATPAVSVPTVQRTTGPAAASVEPAAPAALANEVEAKS